MSQPSVSRGQTGRRGENIAASWLTSRGYRVVERNWRRPCGELDLIAERDGEVIAIEVKTRRGDAMGAPEEAITPAKRRKLIATLQTYLMERGAEQAACRIDVIAVRLDGAGRWLETVHYPSAVTLDE
ncbi:MAG TPA: YraN family protein [Ktedonobacterales bacterium]|nr:YraN family protein [Ktedonobacterales bacterium]